MDIFSSVALGRKDDVRKLAKRRSVSLQQRMNKIEDARQPLHYAVLKNLPDMVEVLVACDMDVNSKTAWGLTSLCLANRINATVMMELLGRSGAEIDLSTLVGTGQLVQALGFLERKALLGPTGAYHLLLHFTARENLSQAAALLLMKGADPNAFGKQIVDELVCSVTPLHRAASYGQWKWYAFFWNMAPIRISEAEAIGM